MLALTPTPTPPLRAIEANTHGQNEIKKKAEMSKPGAPMSPRQQEINAQMNELKAQAAPKRAAIKKIDDQIRHLNSNAEKIKDMNARSSSLPYRNLAELEKAIRDLDAKVSTGKMKIVDEKKAQQEILVLNRRKNDFKAIEDLQKTVDADRLKIEALEEQRAEAGYQDIEAQIKKLDAEYKTIKAERDHA